ncbi:MAG: hypothetical protein MJE77_02935 [Proteobacteria bacterium]|nr:hypothetical protein [Pseudomonadota bacterium]
MKRWLIFISIAVLVYAGWQYLDRDGESSLDGVAAEDPALIFDRVWVDSKPAGPTDHVHVFMMLADVPYGAFQKSSSYHGEFEIFEYRRQGDKVRTLFPQTESKKRFKYRVTTCDDLPPFDLCLELSKNPWGGPKRYYGIGGDSDAAVPGFVELGARMRSYVQTQPVHATSVLDGDR